MEQVQIKEEDVEEMLKLEMFKYIINKVCDKDGERYIFGSNLDEDEKRCKLIEKMVPIIIKVFPCQHVNNIKKAKKPITTTIRHMIKDLSDHIKSEKKIVQIKKSDGTIGMVTQYEIKIIQI